MVSIQVEVTGWLMATGEGGTMWQAAEMSAADHVMGATVTNTATDTAAAMLMGPTEVAAVALEAVDGGALWSETSEVADQGVVATGVAEESQVEVGAMTAGVREAEERKVSVEGLAVAAREGEGKLAEDSTGVAMPTVLQGSAHVAVAAAAIAAVMERIELVAVPAARAVAS